MDREIIEAVDNINYQLMEQLGDDNAVVLEYNYVTYNSAITFLDTVIWDYDNNGREWIEEVIEDHPDGERFRVIPAHYEAMEPYLRKKIMSLLENLKKIQL